MTIGESNCEQNPIEQYPYVICPQPISQRRRMHLEAYVGGVSCPIRTSCSKRERSRWQNIVEQRKDLCSGCAYSPATTLSLYVMTGLVQTLPSTTSASSSASSSHICHTTANMLVEVVPVQRAAEIPHKLKRSVPATKCHESGSCSIFDLNPKKSSLKPPLHM